MSAPNSARNSSPDYRTRTTASGSGPNRNNQRENGNENANAHADRCKGDCGQESEAETNVVLVFPTTTTQLLLSPACQALPSPKTPAPARKHHRHQDNDPTTTPVNGALPLDMSCKRELSQSATTVSAVRAVDHREPPSSSSSWTSTSQTSMSTMPSRRASAASAADRYPARAPTPSKLSLSHSELSAPPSPALFQSPIPSMGLVGRSTDIASQHGPGSSSLAMSRRFVTLHQQLQRSTTTTNSGTNLSVDESNPWSGQRRAGSAFGMIHDANGSNGFGPSLSTETNDGSMMMKPLTQPRHHSYPQSSIGSGPVPQYTLTSLMRLQPSSTSITVAADITSSAHTINSPTLVTSQPLSGQTSFQGGSGVPELEVSDTHSGVIMASPGPALYSPSSPSRVAASTADTGSSSGGRGDNSNNNTPGHRWDHLSDFLRALVSQSLISRLFSRRPHFFSVVGTASSWSVIRILNTCHLLYLIPVTTITMVRLLTTEMICDEQLYSWLTVQAFIFISQIACACYILHRQSMTSRISIMDQRSRILLLVLMIWTALGVGFLGADNSRSRDPSCSPSNDPVFSLSFKIIVFHMTLIGFYFLPFSSFVLSRVLPGSISSGLSRTATKPMIDKLESIPMTEGLFGGDPEDATCAICLGDYTPDETIRFLPCRHHFHLECVDQWLLTDKSCPLCKHDIDKPVVNERSTHASSRFQTINTLRRDEGEFTNHTGNNATGTDRFQVIVQ